MTLRSRKRVKYQKNVHNRIWKEHQKANYQYYLSEKEHQKFTSYQEYLYDKEHQKYKLQFHFDCSPVDDAMPERLPQARLTTAGESSDLMCTDK